MPLGKPFPSPPQRAVKTFLCLLSAFALAHVGRAEVGAASSGGTLSGAPTEVVFQRDAEGRVRVQREVRQNAQGDYVNHGVWRAWDAAGQLAGQGRYDSGQPIGAWTWWADADALPPHLEGFTAPFLSQATYRDGQLDGVWSLYDAQGRLASEVRFCEGRRHGAATLWTPTGQVCRRWEFEQGRPVGKLQVLSEAGELVVTAQYEAGCEVVQRVERYENGRLKTREDWLGGLQQPVEADDPERLGLARFEPSGDELRNGLREAWWPNGQPKLRVEYRLGKAVGEARWWHENGQLALRGSYHEGLASGQWNWWRESGLKAASCRYDQGAPQGEWSLWSADGQRQPTPPTGGRLVQRPVSVLIR